MNTIKEYLDSSYKKLLGVVKNNTNDFFFNDFKKFMESRSKSRNVNKEVEFSFDYDNKTTEVRVKYDVEIDINKGKKYNKIIDYFNSSDLDKSYREFAYNFIISENSKFALEHDKIIYKDSHRRVSIYLYYNYNFSKAFLKVKSNFKIDNSVFYDLHDCFKIENSTYSERTYKENIIESIVKHWLEFKSIPAQYNFDLKVGIDNKCYGLYKLNDGTIFFIPKFTKPSLYDRRKEFLNLSLNGSNKANKIIFFDTKNRILYYSNSSGSVDTFNFYHSLRINDEDILNTFNSTAYTYMNNLSIYSVSSLGTKLEKAILKYGSYFLENSSDDRVFSDSKDAYKYRIISMFEGSSLKYVLDHPRIGKLFLNFIRDKKKDLTSKIKKGKISPKNYLTQIANIQVVLENYKNVDAIGRKIRERRLKFNNVDLINLPEIPNLRDNLIFLNHQGKCLSRLDVAEELAILDLSTGSGKTLIMLCDMLNLLNKKKIARALVIAPNNLVPQMIGDFDYFTGGSVNIVPITTETVNSWGLSNIANLCKTAPINTIFLSTYSFIANRDKSDIDEFGNFIFPNVNFLQSCLDIDYIAVDESHFIKNHDSLRSIACRNFIDIQFKRLSTGTLIPHSPTDLVGQINFLNPSIIGTPREFGRRYGIGGVNKNGKPQDWKVNAKDKIREDLSVSTYYLNYNEKDYAASLPDIDYGFHFVNMSNTQKKIYNALIEDVMDDIYNDPFLSAEWSKFTSISADSLGISAPLLGKLSILEQYLTAPVKSSFFNFIYSKKLKDNDTAYISPKINKIDDLIEASIKKGEYKVLVAVHYKISARHLLEHSRFKDNAVYYDASCKENLVRFREDKNIKVMFGVLQSLNEGLNLQFCDRIIAPDVDWSSGKLKQLIARCFRPNIDKITLSNLNEGKKVFIDIILCNNSADIMKYCYQVYFKLFNAQIMEKSPIEKPDKPKLGTDYLNADNSLLNLNAYLDKDKEYYAYLKNELEKARKEKDFTPIKPIKTGSLGGSKIVTPWVENMPIPVSVEGEFVFDWLVENGYCRDLKRNIDAILNKKVVTEFGIGRICGCTVNTVKVDLNHSIKDLSKKKTVSKINLKANKVVIIDGVDSYKDYSFNLFDRPIKSGSKPKFEVFNEYYAITSGKKLGKKFNRHSFYYVKVNSFDHAKSVVTNLKKEDFSMSKNERLLVKSVVTKMDGNKYNTDELPVDLDLFFNSSNGNSKNIYPLIKEDKVYLIIPENKAVEYDIDFKKMGFKFRKDLFVFHSKDRNVVEEKFNNLN